MVCEKQRETELHKLKAEILASVPQAVRDELTRSQAGQVGLDFEPELLSNPPLSREVTPPEGAPTTPNTRRNRAFTTGRNQQLNIKASAEYIERFYAQVDARGLKIAEGFELAVKVLEGLK